MSVEDYMKQNGLYQLYTEMAKIRSKENQETKKETIEEVESSSESGSGSGSGTGPGSEDSEIASDEDIDSLFTD